MISLFTPSGKKLFGKGEMFEQINYAAWQPANQMVFKKPDIRAFQAEAQAEEDNKPKRTFAYGGGNSSFSQLMRQEMGKAGDQGPRKLDNSSKQEYQQISKDQAS